jgi:type I site-specific restriction endonuclease
VTVGMMTTGYDCSDLLNIVFLRPVFSPTDFVQMKGRGTRKHTFKYVDADKNETRIDKTLFKLFDCFGNCEYFEEKFEELCNGLEKKIIFIKKYQKKFDEVQIYIQRECQYYPRYKKLFDDYDIMPFILKNENLLISKKKLIHEIKLIVKQFNIITKEN